MARIRTIKPDFFRHEYLFEAEKETGLPLRVAFSGLWTVADKAGRFKWKPRELKLDCLPFDEVDFSRVLDALATRGFIEKYERDGQFYGWVPSWDRHQVINNRETESILPDPHESTILTREARVSDASGTRLKHAQAEGKGREGKGREGESAVTVASRFDEFWAAWPSSERKQDKKKCDEHWKTKKLDAVADRIVEDIAARKTGQKWANPKYIEAPLVYLHNERWNDGYQPERSAGFGRAAASAAADWVPPEMRGEKVVAAEVV